MSGERVRPIRPDEVVNKKVFPDEVFESFNELIARESVKGRERITVGMEEVVKLMVRKGLKRDKIFENHWLDVEGVYEEAGWKVEYDQPAYADTPFKPYFTFTPRRRRV